MSKTVQLFSLVLIFVVFDLFGIGDVVDPIYTSVVRTDLEKYRLYVTMVDPEFHCFALSNNMVFNIPKKNWETTSLPEVGTEVSVYPSVIRLEGRSTYNEQGDFMVKYSQESMEKQTRVWMTRDSEQYCLSYVSSESVCTKPAGWVIRGVYQNVLTLSDGSKWILPKDARVKFVPGDRIILSKTQEGDYAIIDIDQSIFVCDESKSLPHAFTWYKYKLAKPYVIAQE
jgi:hypothetical protein